MPRSTELRASVRSERLEVHAGSQAVALALHPRMGDINRRALIPVIERVLREMDVPGRQVRIDRLRIDLGTVPLSALDAELPRRLERELRRELGEALRAGSPPRGVRARSAAEARAELLEQNLSRGTLPFWAPRGTTLQGLVVEMADADPAALDGSVRRLGRERRVLERLAAQLRDPALARLVRVLEPRHAALVLAYVAELRRTHRRRPVLPLGAGPFRRLLWVLVQTYLVRDPGTQFNRRSFLGSVLRGMAREEGLDYGALLHTLARALESTAKRRPVKSSLPAVVAVLLRDHQAAAAHPTGADLPIDERSEHCGASVEPYRHPTDRPAPRVARGSDTDPAAPADRHGRDRRDGAEDRSAPPAPPHARDLAEHPQDALNTSVDQHLDHRTDQISHVAGDESDIHRDQQNQQDPQDREYGGDRTDREAQEERVDRADAVDAVDTIDTVETAGSADRADTADTADGEEAENRAASLERTDRVGSDLLRSVFAGDEVRWDDVDAGSNDVIGLGPRERARPADAARLDAIFGASRGEPRRHGHAALSGYDLADAAAYLLRNGVLPWSAALRDPGLTEQRVLSTLAELPHARLLDVLQSERADERRQTVAMLARALAEGDLARLLPRLVPWAAREDRPFRQALLRFAEAAPDRRVFLARVIAAAARGDAIDLEALAAEAGVEIDTHPPELTTWPAHRLRSALVHALHPGGTRDPQAPTPAALLEALAATHPGDARQYLRAVGAQPKRAAALARAIPPAAADRLLELLDPTVADTMRAVHTTLATLPTPLRRASSDELREVMLSEMMGLPVGEVPDQDFFARVLEQVFGPALPARVGEHLLAAADAWGRPGGLPPAHVAAFRAAVLAALPETAGPAPAARDRRRRPAAAEPGLRHAVLAYLLGHDPTPLPAPPPVPAGEDADQAAAAGPGLSPDVLRHALARMVDEAPDQISPFLLRHSADRRVRERWVRVLPDAALARLTRALEPGDDLLAMAEVLEAAWAQAAPPGCAGPGARPAFWAFVLEFLARHAGAGHLADRLVVAFFADHAARCRALSQVPDLAELGARLLDGAGRMAVSRGHGRLRAALSRQRHRLLTAWDPAAQADAPVEPDLRSRRRRSGPSAGDARRPPSAGDRGRASPPAGEPPRRPPAFRPGGAEPAAGDGAEPIYVHNAGLVLASPFLPRLFERLELMAEGDDGRPRIRDGQAASRGVHLLQYLVDGRTRTPEPALSLNKLLCGLELATPVDRGIDATDAELALCDGLLEAMRANWPALAGTSVAGLRETFLQRDGKLERAGDTWRLTVQRKTVDVLVDRVPWTVKTVFHRWMPEPLHVTW